MRLFIAIDFSELEGYFVDLQNQIQKEDISLAKSFHLTLKFLGEVSPKGVKSIIEKLSKIKFRPFSFELDNIGVFPNEKLIRVIWVGINPENEVIALQRKVDEALYSPMEKDYKAHITLARVKYISNSSKFIETLRKIKVENKKIDVKSFKLMKSTLSRAGPVYEEIKNFIL